MTITELYCKIRGHRFMPWSYQRTVFNGIASQGGKCVRCHETLYRLEG